MYPMLLKLTTNSNNHTRSFSCAREQANGGVLCLSRRRLVSIPLPNKTGEEEEDDGPTLLPLDPNSASLLPSSSEEGEEGYDADGLFGPLALLAVGLPPKALEALAGLLEDDLEARGVVPAFAATESMLSLDLCSSFEEVMSRGDELCLFTNRDVADIAPRSSVERPAVVLSGMSSPEVVSVVSAWQESRNSEKHGEILFCAAVPSNWKNRTLRQLVEDIAGDAAEVEGKGKKRT